MEPIGLTNTGSNFQLGLVELIPKISFYYLFNHYQLPTLTLIANHNLNPLQSVELISTTKIHVLNCTMPISNPPALPKWFRDGALVDTVSNIKYFYLNCQCRPLYLKTGYWSGEGLIPVVMISRSSKFWQA